MIGRVFRIVRTPLTLLALLGVLCYGAWWGYSNVLQPVPAAPPKPCVQQPVRNQTLQSAQVTVNVYNGGDRRGLAGDVGRSLRERGFRVQATGNLSDQDRYRGQRVSQTVIVGANVKNPEVLLVQGFFKKAKVQADKTRVDRSVDVLLGDEYGGFQRKAKTSIAVKARSICLPSPPAANPLLGG